MKCFSVLLCLLFSAVSYSEDKDSPPETRGRLIKLSDFSGAHRIRRGPKRVPRPGLPAQLAQPLGGIEVLLLDGEKVVRDTTETQILGSTWRTKLGHIVNTDNLAVEVDPTMRGTVAYERSRSRLRRVTINGLYMQGSTSFIVFNDPETGEERYAHSYEIPKTSSWVGREAVYWSRENKYKKGIVEAVLSEKRVIINNEEAFTGVSIKDEGSENTEVFHLETRKLHLVKATFGNGKFAESMSGKISGNVATEDKDIEPGRLVLDHNQEVIFSLARSFGKGRFLFDAQGEVHVDKLLENKEVPSELVEKVVYLRTTKGKILSRVQGVFEVPGKDYLWVGLESGHAFEIISPYAEFGRRPLENERWAYLPRRVKHEWLTGGSIRKVLFINDQGRLFDKSGLPLDGLLLMDSQTYEKDTIIGKRIFISGRLPSGRSVYNVKWQPGGNRMQRFCAEFLNSFLNSQY